MKRESLIFLLGIAIVLLPFIGIPSEWKRVGYMLAGFSLALLGYQLRRAAFLRSITQPSGERRADVYVEQAAPLPQAQAEERMAPQSNVTAEDLIADMPPVTRPRRRRTARVKQEV